MLTLKKAANLKRNTSSLLIIAVVAIALASYIISSSTYVTIGNYEYRPRELTIKAGSTVTWINTDLYVHTVRAGTPEKPSEEFNSGDLGLMGIYSHTFTKLGTYEYHCQPHPYMHGKIIVEG